ncbi:hypothetical protein ABZ403_02380 [Micromonospora zamorensis]|uniref:hypothetical protein n=1 Tax=Micromonospora zamorensis TaxID=709883 RepID=UPI0033E59B3B
MARRAEMAEQKDPAETVDPVVDQADPPGLGTGDPVSPTEAAPVGPPADPAASDTARAATGTASVASDTAPPATSTASVASDTARAATGTASVATDGTPSPRGDSADAAHADAASVGSGIDTDDPAVGPAQAAPAEARPDQPAAPVRARASVTTAGALRSDLPVSAPVTATTYRATGSASPADVSLPGQRNDSTAPARASATVPGSSRATAGAIDTLASRGSTPTVYGAGPVNPEPPELVQPPEPAQPPEPSTPQPEPSPTPPGPGPTQPSPPEPEPAPDPGPYPPGPMPTPGPRPTPPPGPVPPVPGPPVPPPSPVPPMPGPPSPPIPGPTVPPPGPPVPAPPGPPGPMPAPPFPPPPAMSDTPGVRASASVSAPPAGWQSTAQATRPAAGGGWAEAPVSAPPVVPAPALPSWPPSSVGTPPSTGSAAGNSRFPGPTAGPSFSSGQGTPGARGGRHSGGTDLAGTVYGSGDGPGFTTIAMPANAVENSGSLTGHILAQGWADTPSERRSNAKVMIVLAAALGLLVAISVMIVLLAGDALDGLVGGALNG